LSKKHVAILTERKKQRKIIPTLNSQNSNLAEKNSSINSIIAKENLLPLEKNNFIK